MILYCLVSHSITSAADLRTCVIWFVCLRCLLVTGWIVGLLVRVISGCCCLFVLIDCCTWMVRFCLWMI